MNVDPVLALVTVARMGKEDWAVHEDQEWLSYSLKDSAFVILPAEAPITRCHTTGVEVAKQSWAEHCLKIHAE